MAIVFLDGDDLRRLNALSYEADNAVIARLGRSLAHQARPCDTLGRWFSGDQFLLVLPGAGEVEAWAEAEKLRTTVLRVGAAWEIPVSVPAGLAVYPQHGRDEDELLTAAYAACAAAKKAAKNRVASP